MGSYPILGLFSEVGTVHLEQAGLYLQFNAQLTSPVQSVPRLYFHGKCTVRLATFSQNMQATGRISCRSLGAAPDCGAFSVLGEPWRPMQISGFDVPVTALKTEDGYLAAFPISAALPDGAVSRFCFLQHAEVCGEPCWILKLDAAGAPRFNS